MKPKVSQRVIVFDTETTGLLLHPQADINLQPHIIEFAAVILERGHICREVSVLINPGQPLSAEITKITGLTDADLKGQPIFAAVLPRLVKLFNGCDMMVAHNLAFDRGMIRNELKRCNVADFPFPQKEVCTVELYKPRWGRRPNLKMLYAEVMGKPLAQKHRALDDVRALAEVVQKEAIWKL